MKVQEKHRPTRQYLVLEQSPNHYIVNTLDSSGPVALPKNAWEPVLEEQWVDVTSKCTINTNPTTSNLIPMINGEFIMSIDGYRLRKIRVCEIGNGNPTQHAFIVEKCEKV